MHKQTRGGVRDIVERGKPFTPSIALIYTKQSFAQSRHQQAKTNLNHHIQIQPVLFQHKRLTHRATPLRPTSNLFKKNSSDTALIILTLAGDFNWT